MVHLNHAFFVERDFISKRELFTKKNRPQQIFVMDGFYENFIKTTFLKLLFCSHPEYIYPMPSS